MRLAVGWQHLYWHKRFVYSEFVWKQGDYFSIRGPSFSSLFGSLLFFSDLLRAFFLMQRMVNGPRNKTCP